MTVSLRDKIRNLAFSAGNYIQHFLDATVRKPVTNVQKMIEMFMLKYLYIFLAVFILSKEGYNMSDGYHISFVLWKECVASALFFLITWIYLRIKLSNRFSRLLLLFLYVLYFIPINSAYSINNMSGEFLLLSNFYFLFLIVCVGAADKFIKPKNVEKNDIQVEQCANLLNNRFVNLFCFTLCVLFIVHKLHYNGFDFLLNMEASVVYDRRAEYQAFFRSISGSLYAYVLTFIRRVISSAAFFYLASGVIRGNIVAIATSSLCVLSSYSLNAGKSTLLLAALMVIIVVICKMGFVDSIERVFIYGMFFLLITCVVEYLIRGESSIFMLIIRREMYMPSWMNGLYYDFFSQNPKILWTDSTLLLQNIFNHVYDLSPLELISNAYFKGLMPSPNTGMFAEAYMHFGAVGTLIYPILLGVAIRVFGLIYREFGPVIQISMAARVVISLTNVPYVRTDSVLAIVVFPLAIYLVPKIAGLLKLDILADNLHSRLSALIKK